MPAYTRLAHAASVIVIILTGNAVSWGQMFQGNLQHTGLVMTNAPVKTPQVKWQFHTGGRVISSPVVVGNTLYIGSEDKRLYALDIATGAPRWSYLTEGAVNSTPAVADGRVYFTSADGYCYAVNAVTGTLLWRFNTRGEKTYDIWDYYLSSPAVWHGLVIFGSGDRRVYALEARTGRRVWSFRTNGIVHAPPAVANDTVYIGSFDGWMYALQAATGKLVWKFKTVGDAMFPVGEVQGGASVTDDGVYFGSRDYNIYALDPKTGAGKWNDKVPGTWIIATPALQGDTLYFGTSDGRSFLAYNARTGQKKWSFPTILNVFSSAALARDTAFFGAFDGRLYAVDLAAGKERWQFRTAASIAHHDTVLNAKDELREDIWTYYHEDIKQVYEAILNLGAILSSPAVDNGVVYVGSCDGTVYALE